MSEFLLFFECLWGVILQYSLLNKSKAETSQLLRSEKALRVYPQEEYFSGFVRKNFHIKPSADKFKKGLARKAMVVPESEDREGVRGGYTNFIEIV